MRPLSLNFERNVRSAKPGYALLAIGCVVTALVIGAQATIYRELQRQQLAAAAAPAKRDAWVLPRRVSSEAGAIAGARTRVGHLAAAGARPVAAASASD